MSVELITLLMFLSMILLLLTGQRVFFIIGAVGAIFSLALWGRGGVDMVFFATYGFMKWYVLLAVPLFIFMGVTLSRSGVADDLFEAIYKWMGGVKGGLGMGTIGICAIIAAMSGTNVAATTTAGIISLPAMLKRKYDKEMVSGLIISGGSLGFLIPPSLVLILYGMIARVSIGRLWVAALLPGILLASMYIAYIGIRCHFQPHLGPPIPVEDRAGWREKFVSLRGAILPIILIFAVLGLLFMGVTTLIECAAVGALGAIVCAAIHRRLTLKLIREVMEQTLTVTSMFLWIVAAALLFSAVYDGLGAVHVMEHAFAMIGGRWTTIAMMMFSWIFLGMVLDDTAMLLIVAPLFIPIVANLGFSLVWFGVLYVINCQLAYSTPPFGYNLFIMRGIVPKDSGITMGDIYRSIIPFAICDGTCLAIVAAFPQIALWLPSIVFGE